MKSFAHVATLSAAVFASGLLLSLPSACSSSDEGSGTSGRRIALDVKVMGSPEATQPFTNAQGWSITLSKALVSTGPLYYYDGATIFSGLEPTRAPTKPLWDMLGERTAFAHPGHYVPGNAKGELLSGSSVDLRAGALVGTGDGVSGMVRSATFSFQSPATGPFAAELGTHVALLEGTGTKGAETRIFRAEIDPADITNTENATAVEGCPFAESDMQADGVVTLTVNVKQWFDQVELDAVPASTDGMPVSFPADAIGRNELVRGMKEGLAYQFAYAPK